MTMIYDQFGQSQKIEHLGAVQRLEGLKEKNGSNPWPVIEECIQIWKQSSPTQWKSYLVYLDELKSSRKTSKVGRATYRGVSKDNEQGGYTSYVMDIPEKVMLMIRCMYNSDELPMNKDFYYELGKRFPTLLVREKV